MGFSESRPNGRLSCFHPCRHRVAAENEASRYPLKASTAIRTCEFPRAISATSVAKPNRSECDSFSGPLLRSRTSRSNRLQVVSACRWPERPVVRIPPAHRSRVRISGIPSAGYQPPLGVTVAIDIPLRGVDRAMTCKQLNIAQRTSGFMYKPSCPRDECSAARMRGAAIKTNGAIGAAKPDDDAARFHLAARSESTMGREGSDFSRSAESASRRSA